MYVFVERRFGLQRITKDHTVVWSQQGKQDYLAMAWLQDERYKYEVAQL